MYNGKTRMFPLFADINSMSFFRFDKNFNIKGYDINNNKCSYLIECYGCKL